ncbi:MAG: redoxin domain-containing protein [Clostridiales bacterium]|nr:redoxin domain-containing protein [Clostridiales bacterium]
MKSRKRILSILLAAVIIFATLPLTAYAAGTLSNFRKVNTYRNGVFNDVSSSAWYADEVRSAYELGLMKGSGGAFSPNGTVTLAETITMAARIHSIYYNGSANFQQNTPWYSVYVDYAKQVGIITRDYTNYNVAATRAQFASIFAHALPASALAGINDIADGAFSDVSASHANAQEIYLLYRAGVLTGNGGKFSPASSIRRSEAATIITRMALPNQRVKLETETAPTYTWEGDPSLDFTVQMADGSSFTLSEQAGKVVMVNFWATWCGPCVRELPDIARLYEEYSSGEQVKIVTINVGESVSTVQRFLDRQSYTIPVAFDTNRIISGRYNITNIPRTVIFNKDGTVSWDHIGALTSGNYERLKSVIEDALER